MVKIIQKQKRRENKSVSVQASCPVCLSTDVTVFLEIDQVPVHCNILLSNKRDALQTNRGNIHLAFCKDCGHIFNQAFDPELMEYTQAYETSLHYSSRFQSYADEIANHLVERYQLYGKDIVEIGCGKGEFLKLLCYIGDNKGVGFDPSYEPEDGEEIMASGQITFIQEFYSENHTNYKADLICCRHVLEHIQFPRDFLGMIRRSVANKPKTVVFLEVPNALFTLKDQGIWDLIYEHCSYFTRNSLYSLLTHCGFEVYDLFETYEGQFLCVEAFPSERLQSSDGTNRDELGDLVSEIGIFAEKYRQKVNAWKRNIDMIVQNKQRAVVWGGGSKGVTFLNTLKTRDKINYVVDINPRKQGKYVVGTGQKIVPPEFLKKYQPVVVIIMNPIYHDEVEKITKDLGLDAGLVCA